MEQKHLDETEDSYFGEETIDDDYPILKVEEKKGEKKKEKKEEKKEIKEIKGEKRSAPAKAIKTTPQIHISSTSKLTKQKESDWEMEREEEILITPARMNTPLKELVKENKPEARPEYKPEIKPEVKPIPPVPAVKSAPSADPDNFKNKAEPHLENNKGASSESSSGGSGWKWAVFLLVVLVIIAFLTHGFGLYSPAVNGLDTSEEEIVLANVTPEENVTLPMAEVPVKNPSFPVTTEKGTELTLLAKRWMFDPNTLYVKVGEDIKLTVKATDLDFVFSIPDLGIQSAVSGITLVEFTPSKAGTYKFKCSSCDSWRGMEGKLVVK